MVQQRERPAMVDRARAFKRRVLKKLYCSSLEEKIKESRAEQEQKEAERKTTNNDAIGAAQIVPEGRKVYTVSLPSGYEVCATRPSETDESEESSEQSEGRHSTKNFQRKRKRQRKCKSSVHEGLSEKAQTEFQQPRRVQTDSLQAVTLDSAKPEAEILTKNRRRKLKKKRHKEKLRAAGLVTKAIAVELIYQPDENSNDDIAEGGKIVGVMDSNET